MRDEIFWPTIGFLSGLGAVTFDRKKVEVLVAGIVGSVVPFKTDTRIALLQSKHSDIFTVCT